MCVCGCQSVPINSIECERRTRYSSSLTGFSHRFSDSSVITALLWNMYVCARARVWQNECHGFDDCEKGSQWILFIFIFTLLLCKGALKKHCLRTKAGTKADIVSVTRSCSKFSAAIPTRTSLSVGVDAGLPWHWRFSSTLRTYCYNVCVSHSEVCLSGSETSKHILMVLGFWKIHHNYFFSWLIFSI